MTITDRRAREEDRPASRLRTGLLAVGTLAVLVPLVFAVLMALKTDRQAASGSGFDLPSPLELGNFRTAWELTDFPRAFAVSLLISVVAVAGQLIVSSLAAYAIARNWDRRLFRWSYFYLLAAMFIPFPVVALPQVKLTSMVGLDNPLGVAVLHILFGISFNILLYTAFLRSIPYELEESARIDGCSTWQTFWKLIFPLLAPMNATVGIFAFLMSWNDFMMPSMIIGDPSMQTIPVVQKIFQLKFSSNYNVAFASYLMAMAPTLLAYLFAQRWVMSGVTRGAIK
ncbi:carbohydrate ABC transporter permease [Streptomyces luteolus]|uniref:Carbohydrate ABC transporter permease n=1 Tax=Streptomyces luteolus TaxID=3043615 RepID=A0ABT6T4N6_9ACTN|nr:carbohydrate ABC transporter permease [Streptomyces sp. B-S-A12]MDI3422019.1 carbohydrate ABC transporter permease [Streptomyces sp. B-S-A12]